jgi:WD40 repeat protein
MQTIVGFDRITAVAIDAKSEQVFVAGAGNSSKVLRWDDGTMQYVETTETFPEEVNSAVWNDAGDRLYLAHGNGVDMFVYNNDTKVYELQGTLADHTNTVRSLAISSNSSWLSSAGDDQTVLIYQWNGTEYKKFSTQTSDSAILQISTSSDGSLLSSTTSTTSTFFQYGIDCSNDPYSHGTRSSPTTCSCKDRFYWSPKF